MCIVHNQSWQPWKAEWLHFTVTFATRISAQYMVQQSRTSVIAIIIINHGAIISFAHGEHIRFQESIKSPFCITMYISFRKHFFHLSIFSYQESGILVESGFFTCHFPYHDHVCPIQFFCIHPQNIGQQFHGILWKRSHITNPLQR